MNETTVAIVGRVINTPEYRQTANDIDIAKFRMASNERRYDKESGTWIDGDTLYVNVTCWRRLAFAVHACLDKGDPVIVTGRLYTRGFEVEGQRRSVTELEAWSVGPDLARCTVKVHRRGGNQAGELADVDQYTPADQPGAEPVDAEAGERLAVAA